MRISELQACIDEVNDDAEVVLDIIDIATGEKVDSYFCVTDDVEDFDKLTFYAEIDTCAFCRQLRRYLKSVGNLSYEEKTELIEWVDDGNSVYDNPFDFYGENGRPIDFITSRRLLFEILNNMPDSSDGNPDNSEEIDELPF
jgi:hypothetical protein